MQRKIMFMSEANHVIRSKSLITVVTLRIFYERKVQNYTMYIQNSCKAPVTTNSRDYYIPYINVVSNSG